MRNYFTILSALIAQVLMAQVGVGVENPLSMLHINGAAQITKDLKVNNGNSGNPKEFLMSRGEGDSPIWSTPVDLNIPTVVVGGNMSNVTSLPSSAYQFLSVDNHTILNSNFISPLTSNGLQYYEVKKSGYYLVDANVITKVNSTSTDGTFVFGVYTSEETLLENSTAYPNNAPSEIKDNISGVMKLNLGDYIIFSAAYTRNIDILGGSLSFTYLYNDL